ncbi:hypothetical protein ES703_104677 [subsurface metagenome]
MGTFSTKASNALEKVLKRKTLVEISQLLTRLGLDLDNCVNETARIEQEADRVLDVKYYKDGSEMLDQGPLAANLTRNLDGPSITRAISTATTVLDLVKSRRSAWILEQKAKHDARDPYMKWDESLLAHHGPGVVPKDNPI